MRAMPTSREVLELKFSRDSHLPFESLLMKMIILIREKIPVLLVLYLLDVCLVSALVSLQQHARASFETQREQLLALKI